MLAQTQDEEQVIARVAALDIGKAELVCCARVPDEDRPGRRLQEVATYATMTRPLLGMAGHLRCLGVTRVVMEATGRPQAPGSPPGPTTACYPARCWAARPINGLPAMAAGARSALGPVGRGGQAGLGLPVLGSSCQG